MKPNLTRLIEFFGWQGGTLVQVTEEVNKRLKGTYTPGFTASEILQSDSLTITCIIYLLEKHNEKN